MTSVIWYFYINNWLSTYLFCDGGDAGRVNVAGGSDKCCAPCVNFLLSKDHDAAENKKSVSDKNYEADVHF